MYVKRVVSYFLFLAIITGGFASMAQNNYGLVLISFTCFAFALLFLVDLLFRKNKGVLEVGELVGLVILSSLLGLRASYIHIAYIEWVVIINSVLLSAIYIIKLNQMYQRKESAVRFMLFIMVFYLGLILLLVSMAISIVLPLISQGLGAIGFGMLLIYGSGYFLIKRGLIDGEEYTVLGYVRTNNPNAMVLATAFFMISIYAGLYMVQLIPPLYTGKVPPKYLELVRNAESGKEQPVNGTFEHDRYKNSYDAFVEKNK